MSWPYQVTIQAIYPVWGQSATFAFATSILISHGVSKHRLQIHSFWIPFLQFQWQSKAKVSQIIEDLHHHGPNFCATMLSRVLEDSGGDGRVDSASWSWQNIAMKTKPSARIVNLPKVTDPTAIDNLFPGFPGYVSICRIIDSDNIKPIWSESIDPSLPSATSTSQSRGRSALISSPNAAPEEAQINSWIWINGRSWRRLNHECWLKKSECCSCGMML